jgi:hypothetical protein
VSELESLADLQDLDTKLDQLAHRRETMSERAAVLELEGEASALGAKIKTISDERHVLERDQRRLEDEVAVIEDKKATDVERMFSMTSPKELSAMQDELASLGRRQEVLEDQVLELMEQIEPLSETLSGHEERQGKIADETGRLEAAIVVAEAEIDAEVASISSQRETHLPTVREDLVARYDKLRSRGRGGVVVGRVVEGHCSACGLQFSSVFIDELKHSNRSELLQCDECGVLLVP